MMVRPDLVAVGYIQPDPEGSGFTRITFKNRGAAAVSPASAVVVTVSLSDRSSLAPGSR